uniref:DRBM domain-containing protein n=1 Tax=Aegilops tauschii subsp. strangulata TaxID=200361 RepID=A0A453JVY1_AEGTS
MRRGCSIGFLIWIQFLDFHMHPIFCPLVDSFHFRHITDVLPAAYLQTKQVLGDVIESLAGAIYLDSKYDKEVVWKSMKQLLEPLATPETVERDPVKLLQEFCARRSYSSSYTKAHKDGVSSVVVEVQVEGTTYSATETGPDKIVAKKLAAKSLLNNLKAIVP